METLDAEQLKVIHLDGKVVRNAGPAPARLHEDPDLAQGVQAVDTLAEQQKPKAEESLTLVNFQTRNQRLIDQIAVPQNTNEEAAVAAHLPKMDLRGTTVIADAAQSLGQKTCSQEERLTNIGQRSGIITGQLSERSDAEKPTQNKLSE